MDKKTLSHYGWIVVLILVISVLLALATPFGEYVGKGIVSIATGFKNSLDKEASVEKITENKENVDTLLNGEFIITDKQGSEDCYVYQVNNIYDAYSLTLSETSPELNDKYFRCIRYVDIEENDEVQEMFYLVKENNLSSTEQKQGISYYLLSLVNETDYTDTVSSLGSVQLDTYNLLKSSKGTVNEELYEDVELIAVEKDGYVDVLLTKANVKLYTVDVLYGKGTLSAYEFLEIEGQKFCIDRKIARAFDEMKYHKINTPDDVDLEAIQKICYVIEQNKVDSLEYKAVSQIMIYKALEPNVDFTGWTKLYVGTDYVALYEDLTSQYENLTEFDKYDIQFYEYHSNKPANMGENGGFQRLMGYTVPKYE